MSQLCHCNARLADDVELMKGIMEAKANAVGHCLDILYRERQPDEQEPMQPARNDTCGGKARGKGTPLRVPQVGDENGPKWIKEGKACGWKLWVGDLPNDVSKAAIAHHCAGFVDIACNKAPSGAIFAIVTFHDLAAAIKAFEQVAMATFHQGRGQMMWPSVRWARPKAMGTG